MPKNTLKYAVLLVLIAVVAYNSVYFKKLDEVKASAGATGGSTFDAATYAQKFWAEKLRPATSTATDLGTLTTLLKTDKAKGFDTYSHALGIGNIRYFLVKGEGKITSVGSDDVSVTLSSGETVKLATEYVFGNAARDASGLIKITEFDNTMDLNNVSAELNSIIRKQVVPPFKASAKPGSFVKFVGAIELNREHLHLDNLEVIPIVVELVASRGNGTALRAGNGRVWQGMAGNSREWAGSLHNRVYKFLSPLFPTIPCHPLLSPAIPCYPPPYPAILRYTLPC